WRTETVSVQAKCEGNGLDFAMEIPTPSQPKLHEMPRDFFKHLAVYSILKKREFPYSKLLPIYPQGRAVRFAAAGGMAKGNAKNGKPSDDRKPTVAWLEADGIRSLALKS